MLCAIRKRPEPACPPVESEERDADDDRGERERQIDEGVDEPLAGEAPAHDREPADHAEDRVQRHRDRDGGERDLEGVQRVGVFERLPGPGGSLDDCPVGDEPERGDEDQRQVAEREARAGRA